MIPISADTFSQTDLDIIGWHSKVQYHISLPQASFIRLMPTICHILCMVMASIVYAHWKCFLQECVVVAVQHFPAVVPAYRSVSDVALRSPVLNNSRSVLIWSAQRNNSTVLPYQLVMLNGSCFCASLLGKYLSRVTSRWSLRNTWSRAIEKT